ncbi:MAG TPA: molybdopterin cofactor-binding domain-containing protein [Candidatus Limnocylindrales bacterium]
MHLTVNGEATTVDAPAEHSLLHVLRENLGLTAAKPGCGEGACGACTVLVDGKPTRSCVTAATSVADSEVDTLEGLRDDGVFAQLVAAFADVRAFQCGYCTPGMIVAAGALLRSNASPTVADIVEALNGNVCRCGTYPRIIAAIQRAADSARDARHTAPANREPEARSDERFASGAPTPWDLAEPDERDWFDRLGDGLVVVLSPDETHKVNAERGGAWSTPGGAWLHIGVGGHVTAFSGKVDVGQDNTTALRALVAHELGIDPDRVDLVMGDTDFCPHDMGTFGSRSTEDAGGVLGAVAASAREWLDANSGKVQLATRSVIAARADAPRRPQTAKSAESPAERRAALAIASGRTRYTSDVVLPGMGHGRAAHPPVHGASLVSADFSAVPQGTVIATVQEPGFVGVVAPDPFSADSAIAAVEVDWDTPDLPGEDELDAYLRSHPIDESGWEGAFEDGRGNVERALGNAALTYDASFTTAYLAHAPLETRCAVAAWDENRVTIWTGTQVPFGVRGRVAAELNVDESNVRVIVPATGSGYGGKHSAEAAVEAAKLARASGRPVKVRWSRADEFAHAYFRPAALIDIRAGLDDRGRVTAWQHTNINSGPMGIRSPYEIANVHVRYQPADSPLHTGSYRALAATANNFARESAMDELAHLAGEDALDFRLRHLKDGRLADVLKQAADRGGWATGGESAGRGVGIACGFEKGGRIATCVEVSQPTVGEFKLTRIVAAYDCGRVVDPDNLRNQIEGALVMGLGGALFEAVHFEHGRITNGAMEKYRVPRFSDVPPIDVILADRPTEPSVGAGETPIIAIAPAIANAIFALTGERRRSLPLLG